MKHIAVLTSGGDAPGMNAAIRSVVQTGIAKGWLGAAATDHLERGEHAILVGLLKGEIRQHVAGRSRTPVDYADTEVDDSLQAETEEILFSFHQIESKP